jgi:hypothetical protein
MEKEHELSMASARGIRDSKRKRIETPEGVFIIRKLQPLDFLSGDSVLPLPELRRQMPQGSPDPRLREMIEKDVAENLPVYIGVLLSKGVVSPRISRTPVADDADAIWINDLEQSTIDTLVVEIQSLQGIKEGGDNFREQEARGPVAPTPDGESIPNAPERDSSP